MTGFGQVASYERFCSIRATAVIPVRESPTDVHQKKVVSVCS